MDLYGPALPPGYTKPEEVEQPDSETREKRKKLIGPQFPAFLCKKENSKCAEMIGPQLPQHIQAPMEESSSEDDEVYGPILNQVKDDCHDANRKRAEIEKRAEKMKDKLHNKDQPTVETVEREEWMTVPDTSRKNQLGAISRCLAPEKASLKEKRSHRHAHKDRKTAEELSKYNKAKRSESLLEMHKKNKKKKDIEKSKKPERKIFDRDEMAVRHFSKDQVNSVVDKARFLNSRFAGGDQKYL